jgi:hypothetical protein
MRTAASTMLPMHQPPDPSKKAAPAQPGFQPTVPMDYAGSSPSPRPNTPRVDLDLLENKLLTLREEMRLLHARLETLNLFTRLGVKPAPRPGR